MLATLWQDLHFGLRTLVKDRGFAWVALCSLALGIGANSAVFSVVNALLLRPLPYREAERLTILWNRSPGLNVAQDWFSPGQYLDVKTQNQTFEQTAIAIGASFNLMGQHGPEHVDGARVSSSFLPLFGAQAALGRIFTAEEDAPAQPAAVVLSHGFWQRAYGGDANVVGRTVTLSGNNFVVAGVLASGFTVTNEVLPAVNAIRRADLFLPLPMNDGARTNRGNEDFNIFARLKPGVSVTQAQADMDVIAARMRQQYPQNYPAHGGLTISVVPLLAQVTGEVGVTLPMLLGAVGFVLLIACANVANLLLARAAGRGKELAVRAAVGAGRGRLMRQLLTESVLLAGLGGVLGLLLAFIAVRALRVFGPDNIPRLQEISLDWRVAAFTFFISLLTGVVFGLAPAWRASCVNLQETLKEGGRGLAGSGSRRMRQLLVVAEVALALILLAGAGLLVRSYQRILASHPGFDPRNVLALRLQLPATKAPKPEDVIAFYQRVLERMRALPGVEAAGVSYSLPMSTVAFAWDPITIEGYVPNTPDEKIMSNIRIVSPGYFAALRVPLRQGRLFDERDKRGAPDTVIINEALAARYWPHTSPLGQRLRQSRTDVWRTVVGVISDAKQFSTENEPPLAVYFPFEQPPARNLHLVVRTTPDPTTLTAAVIKEIHAVDPTMPAFDVATMEQRRHEALARQRFATVLLGVFALLALLTAAGGIYGVLSYTVNQETREIGIRLALGAQPRDVLRLVIGQGLQMVLAGLALGLLAAAAFTRVLQSLLFGVTATDALTFGLVSLLLCAVALVACWIPARRATRVDPLIALRAE
jgi:predicted permease